VPRFSKPGPFDEYDHLSDQDIADFETILTKLERQGIKP